MEPQQPPAAEVVITPRLNGPYLVKGAVRIVDVDGNEYASGEVFALCRCGHSKNKPFCDSSHKEVGFEAPSGPMQPQEPEHT